MKKNLSLVWGQVDVNRGWRNGNAKHKDGIPVPGCVIRILCSVVLAQQLKRKNDPSKIHQIQMYDVAICCAGCGVLAKRTLPSVYLCGGRVCC